MNEFNICGVLIHVKKQRMEQVKEILLSMAGVEVHEVTAEGRMIVTIEGESRHYVADTLTGFYQIEGVLSASMVYQFSDAIETEERITA